MRKQANKGLIIWIPFLCLSNSKQQGLFLSNKSVCEETHNTNPQNSINRLRLTLQSEEELFHCCFSEIVAVVHVVGIFTFQGRQNKWRRWKERAFGEKKGRGEQVVVIQRKEDFDRGAHQIGRRTVLCTSCRLLFLSLCHEGRRVIPLLYKENDHWSVM